MHAETDVRALGECDVMMGVRPPHVEAVGIVEDRRVPVRTGERHGDEIAPLDPSARELDVTGGVAVDDCCRRLEPQGFLDRISDEL